MKKLKTVILNCYHIYFTVLLFLLYCDQINAALMRKRDFQ